MHDRAESEERQSRSLEPDNDVHGPRGLARSREEVAALPIPLERDLFTRRLIRELAGSLQEVVGLEQASGFVSLVGQRMGDWINDSYREALRVPTLNRQQVAAVLVDLKRRIQGDFYIVEESEHRLVLGNRACPFGDLVIGRPALCMMTSNVFGVIAAENLGYARVHIAQAIARGDKGCRVIVELQPPAEDATDAADPSYHEYYKT